MNIDGTTGNKYQGPLITRPYSFGTDAIERQRVSLGQSLIDADFEYGLQATKWQSYSEIRKNPSFYEIPGTDIVVTAVITDGSNPSIITVSTTTPPAVGTIVSVLGLENANRNADRAEGYFIVASVSAGVNFTYTAKGLVGTASESLFTSYTIVRRGGYYNSDSALNTSGLCNIPFTSVISNGTSITVNTNPNPHGIVPGMPLIFTGFNSPSGAVNGTYFSNVSDNISFFIDKPVPIGTYTGGRIYIQPYSYVIHRPFDGGVLISSSIPTFGASVVRQSKKVFRYQSGKGLLWSSGTLFCPNNDLIAITSSGTIPRSIITISTGIGHGIAQTGATIQITGVLTSGYDGTYIVQSVINSNQLTVIAQTTLGDTTGILSDSPRFIITKWHGSSVRVGTFDDQNGIFWEYDGQTLWAVKRSSTFQLTGTSTCSANGTILTGTGTRFTSQLKVNDKIVIRGMTYCVVFITNDTSLTFTPRYRGSANISPGAVVCKIKEDRIPQSQFNIDTIDGNGPSGFRVNLATMQMLGIQYTWYGAGFIDFMIRGTDGNWVYAHRLAQNNRNNESYMRSGNQSVRYEITNETSHATTRLLRTLSSLTTDTTIYTTDDLTYWPSSGTVMIDYELINYTGKTSNTLTGCTRSATLQYNILDNNVGFLGTSVFVHGANTTVSLISVTCCPSLTHWGSAILMDGEFNQDRGYLFNYQINNANSTPSFSLGPTQTSNLFMIRLAPSVSNGIVGDIGSRELLNRAQLLLQRLDVWAQSGTIGQGNVVVSGILNPSFGTTNQIAAANWTSINSTGNGSQPSFAQVFTNFSGAGLGTYTPGSGERIFSTICNAGSQYSIDLSNLKELANGLIGGRNFYPDGPDTLLIQITNTSAATVNITQYSLNLFWSEAQA
jgi:hypothetical protein